MKKTKRLLSFVLAFVMLASCAVFSAQADDAVPSYQIDFVYDVDEATATALISISGGEYSVGRFGFSYNTDALTLITADGSAFDAASDFVKDAVIGQADGSAYTVYTTEETNAVADLIDTESGVVLFAWYTADDKYIDATSEAKPLAEVKFALSDALQAEANPTVAFSKVEETILPVADDAIDADLLGWDNVYVTANKNKEIVVSNQTYVSVSDTYITVDISDVSATSTVTNKTDLYVTIYWNSDENDELNGKIKKYSITVEDSLGNAVGEGAEVLAGVSDENGNYSVVLDESYGLATGAEYTFTITPVTESGNFGIPTSTTASTKSYQGTVVGGAPAGGGSGGALPSNTIKVSFDAVDGTIPEGEQYIYNVAQGSSLTTTPLVIAPEGKSFAGWSVDGTTVIDMSTYKITNAVIFKAVYAYLTHEPFINGYPDGEVKPTFTLTRAEAAAIIARTSADFDPEKTYSVNFSDVAADSWYANYIGYVYEKGIVTGYEGGIFAPDNKITRAEFATIMQRYLGLSQNENPAFTDVVGHWAVAYIGACKDAGLINGYENGEFRPDNEITRAEAVTILNRASGRYPSAAAIDTYVAQNGIPFADLSKSDWYFYEVMEAAFAHLIVFFH